MVVLSGEYIYSLDYPHHWDNIKDHIQWGNPDYMLHCYDCGLFYHYSWWYSFVLFSITSIGQWLGYNAFVFYVLINLLAQFTGVYVIWYLFFKQAHWMSVFIGFCVMSFSVYKVSLIGSGSWYGMNYGILTVVFALSVYLLKHVRTMSRRELMYYGTALGFLGSIFTHIAINYLPILIYAILGIALFFILSIVKNLQKLAITFLGFVVAFVFGAWPFILSLLRGPIDQGLAYGNSVNNETLLDAVFVRSLSLMPDDAYSILYVVFFVSILVLFVFSCTKMLYKFLFISLYVLFVIILMGNQFPLFDLYGWVFHHFPLMNTIRASHRFFYFPLLFQVVFIFFGVEYLQGIRASIHRRVCLMTLSAIVLVISVWNLLYITKVIAITHIPEAYKNVATFLNERSDARVVYLPFGTPLHEEISKDYSWVNVDDESTPMLYKNPFQSIYLINRLARPYDSNYAIFPYSLESIQESMLLDFRYNDPFAIAKNLQYTNADYVIVDSYFSWEKFDVDKNAMYDAIAESNGFVLEKCFDEICIFRKLENEDSDPIYYYGNILKDGNYHLRENDVSFLNGKSVDGYILENLSVFGIGEDCANRVAPEQNRLFSFDITNYSVFNHIMESGALFPQRVLETYQPENVVLFRYTVKQHDSLFAMPILRSNFPAPNNGIVSVTLGGDNIKNIDIDSDDTTFSWYLLNIKDNVGKEVVVSTLKEGYYLTGYPIVVNNIGLAYINNLKQSGYFTNLGQKTMKSEE